MNPSPEDLEKLIHEALRGLPERPAPRSLEDRVFAELARRAALPWWRRSYLQWPIAIRVGFTMLSAAAGALLVGGAVLVGRSGEFAQIGDWASGHFQWFAVLSSVGASLQQAAGGITSSIPSLWLDTALAVLAACYATLVGVGAAAYRAFAPSR